MMHVYLSGNDFSLCTEIKEVNNMLLPALSFGSPAFLGIVLLFAIAVLATFILLKKQAADRLSQTINATITEIHIDATNMSSGWVIIAQWADPKFRQIYTFRSPLLNYRPRQHPGERVLINVNPNNPKNYHMLLDD
jgi:hypothetical protein